jgi:hypothetical protein
VDVIQGATSPKTSTASWKRSGDTACSCDRISGELVVVVVVVVDVVFTLKVKGGKGGGEEEDAFELSAMRTIAENHRQRRI